MATATERDWHLTVADFLAELDAMAETKPLVAAHTANYLRGEVECGRWAAPVASPAGFGK